MNDRIRGILDEILRHPPLEKPAETDKKTCTAVVPLEFGDQKYFPATKDRPADYFNLEAAKAKELFNKGLISIWKGGAATKVIVGDQNRMPGWRPWHPVNMEKTEFDDLLVYVQFAKRQVQIILNLGDVYLPDQFYFPWKHIRAHGFSIAPAVGGTVFEIIVPQPRSILPVPWQGN